MRGRRKRITSMSLFTVLYPIRRPDELGIRKQSCDSEPTPELLLECSCTQTNADNLSACVACVANTIPGAAVVSQAESILSRE